ncbi:MAG: aminotransferase class III-fold pyridoxal phosphate-dependent enzyme [Proteobacteria bacterium]|nr:aminotransferase class III-fold pyridoxal phosphate-dependent enzyme [Pseudomonadota bacterium]
MIERRRKLLGSAYELFYDEPVHLIRGEGVWLFDADGRKYLDMYNNVAHVGHCHPYVVAALTKQISTLNTHTRYLHDNILEYAERLTGKFSDELDTAIFACTGSEANELALRIARYVTGATGIIVTNFAYHGNSQATFEISPSDIAASEIPKYVATVPEPDAYRGEFRGDAAGEKYAGYVQLAVDELRQRGIKPAAFVIDTIMSSGGVVAPPRGYLKKAAQIIRNAGGLFIADEVQPGFGRTGKHFWGYEADGLVPDIVTLGKPMGNGHPLAAIISRRDIIEDFSSIGSYFNTFGGNPVSCAAGLAVIDVIEQEGLQENARIVGEYLTSGLRALAEKHTAIGDIRGTGLFIAVELIKDKESREPATAFTADVVNGLKDRGVLSGAIGPDANILKLRPPMVFSRDNADYMLAILDEALAQP